MEFKKEIDQSLNHIEVPESLFKLSKELPKLYKEGQLELTEDLKVLPLRKPRKKKVWYSAAAAIAITAVLGSGFVSPAVAKMLSLIPFVDMVYDGDGFNPLYGYSDASKKNMTTKIGTTVKENGVSITLKEALYDGRKLGVSYLFETDKEIKDADDIHVRYSEFSFDKHTPREYSIFWSTEKTGPKSFMGVSSYTTTKVIQWKFRDKDSITFTNSFDKISFDPDDKQVIEGKWEFKDVKIKKIPSIKKETNIPLQTDNINEKIIEVFSSPLTISITLDQFKSPLKNLKHVVTDDKGNELLQHSNSYKEANMPEYYIDLQPKSTDTKYIVVTVEDPKTKQKESVKIDLK